MLPFCLIAEVVIGLPLFVLLVRLRLVRWWAWMPLAALGGFVLDMAFGNSPANPEKLLEWMVAALGSAVSFRMAMELPGRFGMTPAEA